MFFRAYTYFPIGAFLPLARSWYRPRIVSFPPVYAEAELTSSPGPDYWQAGNVSSFAKRKHKSPAEGEDASSFRSTYQRRPHTTPSARLHPLQR